MKRLPKFKYLAAAVATLVGTNSILLTSAFASDIANHISLNLEYGQENSETITLSASPKKFRVTKCILAKGMDSYLSLDTANLDSSAYIDAGTPNAPTGCSVTLKFENLTNLESSLPFKNHKLVNAITIRYAYEGEADDTHTAKANVVLTVNKITSTPTITVGTDNKVYYDGSGDELTKSINIEGISDTCTGEQTIYYRKVDRTKSPWDWNIDGGWTTNVPTEPGEYGIKVNAPETDYCNEIKGNGKNGYNTIFEITKRPVTVKVNGANETITYDGEEHDVLPVFTTEDTVFDINNALVKPGKKLTVTEAGEHTTDYKANAFKIKKAASKYFDVTFEVESQSTLTINKAPVTIDITAASATYTFDGTEKTVSGYEITNVSNELYDVTQDLEISDKSVSAKEVGKYDFVLTEDDFKNLNENFDVTFNFTPGSLTIEKGLEVKTTSPLSPDTGFNTELGTVANTTVAATNSNLQTIAAIILASTTILGLYGLIRRRA